MSTIERLHNNKRDPALTVRSKTSRTLMARVNVSRGDRKRCLPGQSLAALKSSLAQSTSTGQCSKLGPYWALEILSTPQNICEPWKQKEWAWYGNEIVMTLQVVYYTPPIIELASKTPCAYSEMCSQPRLYRSTPFDKWDDCIWGHYPSRRTLWAMEGKLPCTKLDKYWSRGRVWSRGPWNCKKINRIAADDSRRQTMVSISK